MEKMKVKFYGLPLAVVILILVLAQYNSQREVRGVYDKKTTTVSYSLYGVVHEVQLSSEDIHQIEVEDCNGVSFMTISIQDSQDLIGDIPVLLPGEITAFYSEYLSDKTSVDGPVCDLIAKSGKLILHAVLQNPIKKQVIKMDDIPPCFTEVVTTMEIVE